MSQQAKSQPRPKHGRMLTDKEERQQSVKLRIAVSDANRKKPKVTLPAVKSFD